MYVEKGSTKHTMSGILLFKLDTIFSMCFASERKYSVLILHIPEYLGIKGDRFFHMSEFFLAVVFVQIEFLQFGAYCLTFAK